MAVRESNGGNNQQFINSRVSPSGLIAGKKWVFNHADENQERGPKYFQEMVRTYDAVPGWVLQTVQE